MISGLILFGFVFTHLVNHSLGLISLEAMEDFRAIRISVTRSWAGTAILLLAAVVHAVLGVEKIISRRLSAISARGLLQIATGILIPVLLARHLIGMRISHELFGVNDNYDFALWAMWPAEAWRQAGLITLVWGHGTIGLYMWIRFKNWFTFLKAPLLVVATLVPVLAFAGFAVAGRQFHATRTFDSPLNGEQYTTIIRIMDIALYLSLALIVAVLLIKAGQWITAGFKPKVSVTYNNTVTKTAPAGLTLLEISREAGIPHASVCGGRARCSTCRVRIVSGGENLPPADAQELKVLSRAGIDTSDIRLACQIRPSEQLSIIPLVPAGRATGRRSSRDKYAQGVEQVVTLMFIDIRGFTKFSEGRLPYDVVYILNQYMGRMSEIITAHSGYVDKFMGDGIMAIFGMEDENTHGATDALHAAIDISKALDELNHSHEATLSEPLRIGIGIHSGEAILGRIGTSRVHTAGERITALGDTVNTASRLEALTKELAQEIVVSLKVLETANVDPSGLVAESYEIRGREDKIAGISLASAAQLSGIISQAR
ncbi:adenylate/guanylate cyclase domain-containing protein [Anderseniella sp. Alg231-50]|uniref:adenylate/guanylate cyclase domain-containing protein n=1 Tax=Anderseniella sp. Alg231-50 TaxID=1922226 RepID=UPI00307C3C6B